MRRHKKRGRSLPDEPLIRDPMLPWLPLFAVMFLLYLTVSVRVEDDAWFATVIFGEFDGDVAAFLNFRYNTWSTRVILEGLMVPLLRYGLVYKAFIAAWYAYAAKAAAEILTLETTRGQVLLSMAFLLIPLQFQAVTGFVCTTINYIFTLTCFLWAVLPVIRRLRGESTALWQDLRSVVLMLIACNMELYAPPFLLLCGALLICTIRAQRFDWLCAMLIVVAFGSIIFTVTAPMNTAEAYVKSGIVSFPGYELLSFTGKMIIALTSTAGGLISTYQIGDSFFTGTLTFCALLMIRGISRERGAVWRVVYSVPLVISAAIGISARLSGADSGFRRMFFDVESGWLTLAGDSVDLSWVVTFVLAVLFLTDVAVCLYRVKPMLGSFYLAALTSRMIMGLTVSVYKSGLRTFTLVIFTLVGASALIAAETPSKLKTPAYAVLSIGAVCSLVENIVFLSS